jgi:hypothetical protein
VPARGRERGHGPVGRRRHRLRHAEGCAQRAFGALAGRVAGRREPPRAADADADADAFAGLRVDPLDLPVADQDVLVVGADVARLGVGAAPGGEVDEIHQEVEHRRRLSHPRTPRAARLPGVVGGVLRRGRAGPRAGGA